MFRLTFTRFVTTSRVGTCLSHAQRHYFQKYSSQSNENPVLATIPIDNLRWFKDLTQRRKSTNIMDTLHDKDKTEHRATVNPTEEEKKSTIRYEYGSFF